MRSINKMALFVGIVGLASAGLLAGDDGACESTKASACSAKASTCTDSKATTGLMKASYKVSGMSCDACVTKVSKALAKVEGVSEPSACYKSGNVKVAYKKGTKEKDVLAAIEKSGFKVDSETLEVNLDGLKCGACSDKVTKALAAVEGVKEKSVCHESKKAVITFDPHKVSSENVLAAIKTSGFEAVQ